VFKKLTTETKEIPFNSHSFFAFQPTFLFVEPGKLLDVAKSQFAERLAKAGAGSGFDPHWWIFKNGQNLISQSIFHFQIKN
jgi:hypothetical protein